MTSVYSKNLQIYNAEQFKASIESSGEPYVYLTFGKVNSWANDSAPPQANTSTVAILEVWKNMVGAKKIQGNDVRLCIPRYDWTANTAYTAYDDVSLNMNDANSKFYVVTDQWNVYKCLSNNNGNLSTVKPTSISTTQSVETADNYIWKYMYTLTDEERLRFVTSEFIPVRTLSEDNGSLQWQVQTNAIDGSVEAIVVTDAGGNYTSVPTITISGDGTGANAVARINSTSNTVETIVITNKGSGYTYGNVIITGGGTGAGANARLVISPCGGHGSDPVCELGGSHVILNPRLRGTEDGVLDVDNEFRQISLMTNVQLIDSTNLASNLVYSQTTTFIMEPGSSEYQEDEIVYQGSSLATSTFRGTVASWNSSLNKLQLIDVFGTPTSTFLTGNSSRTVRQWQTFTNKSLKQCSGDLLYIDNLAPVQRAEDQTEDFKIVISF